MVRFLLDTNVVSEVTKPNADHNVRAFLGACSPEDVFVSAISLGEMRKGIARLPPGQRRRGLEGWFAEFLTEYGGRILVVDQDVALVWGDLSARDRNLPVPDGLIAATALTNGLTVVTRNVKDFRETGVMLVDPWQGSDDD
jgi:predicted nucleic acid-binding protein